MLAFPALFSIINPIGGAFIFLAATRRLSNDVRTNLARQVATYSFFLLNASMLIGAFVLRIFGISIPVLRVAGGIVIALSAWKMLNAGEDTGEREAAVEEAGVRDAGHMAFYPLTMPMTMGPGTISVAIALATGSSGERNVLVFRRPGAADDEPDLPACLRDVQVVEPDFAGGGTHRYGDHLAALGVPAFLYRYPGAMDGDCRAGRQPAIGGLPYLY